MFVLRTKYDAAVEHDLIFRKNSTVQSAKVSLGHMKHIQVQRVFLTEQPWSELMRYESTWLEESPDYETVH